MLMITSRGRAKLPRDVDRTRLEVSDSHLSVFDTTHLLFVQPKVTQTFARNVQYSLFVIFAVSLFAASVLTPSHSFVFLHLCFFF